MARILAIDDSALMGKMVAFTLKTVSHTVTDGVDAKQVLDIARAQSFDLVLSDVNMPIIDSLTLTKKLRALLAFKFTPILVLTTKAGMDKKQADRAAGATGWLVKPFNPEQFASDDLKSARIINILFKKQ